MTDDEYTFKAHSYSIPWSGFSEHMDDYARWLNTRLYREMDHLMFFMQTGRSQTNSNPLPQFTFLAWVDSAERWYNKRVAWTSERIDRVRRAWRTLKGEQWEYHDD